MYSSVQRIIHKLATKVNHLQRSQIHHDGYFVEDYGVCKRDVVHLVLHLSDLVDVTVNNTKYRQNFKVKWINSNVKNLKHFIANKEHICPLVNINKSNNWTFVKRLWKRKTKQWHLLPRWHACSSFGTKICQGSMTNFAKRCGIYVIFQKNWSLLISPFNVKKHAYDI